MLFFRVQVELALCILPVVSVTLLFLLLRSSEMTIPDLVRRKWYRQQELDPDEPLPDGRLSYEECEELADPDHPAHHPVYANLLEEAWADLFVELN